MFRYIIIFQVSKKSDLRTCLQAIVSSGIPDLSTSVLLLDETAVYINSSQDSGFLVSTVSSVGRLCLSILTVTARLSQMCCD